MPSDEPPVVITWLIAAISRVLDPEVDHDADDVDHLASWGGVQSDGTW